MQVNILVKNIAYLQYIAYSFLPRLLAEYTPKLQALQIRECRDVTEMVLSKLRDKKVKIDVRPPPNIHNMRMEILGGQLRQRLNIQI